MRIVGTTKELTVDDDGANVRIIVPLANLQTGIGLRDRHMREKYLEVTQFPNAELQVARAALKLPAPGAEASADARGTLKLHGKTKEVAFRFSAKRDGSAYHVSGALRVNMNDFGIEAPSYLGVSVKPDVDVDVRFDAAD
jgi:polyisoprenoid-binding protein YceI